MEKITNEHWGVIVSRWGIHESHCCPKHGCKYGDNDCPVVLGYTNNHNEHCEYCEDERENPDEFDIIRSFRIYARMRIEDPDDCYGYIDAWGEFTMILNMLEKCDMHNVKIMGKYQGWLK